ncbi:MAG: serine/threonine-protein kinase [Myxococcota bacterium]
MSDKSRDPSLPPIGAEPRDTGPLPALPRTASQPSRPAAPVLVPNSLIGGRYRVLQLLGEGGMGRVYSAVHVDLEKRFALKVLRPELCDEPAAAELFRSEARAASRIGHPNIIEVTDFGRTDDGSLYIVMEHLRGESLAARLDRVRFLATEPSLRILLQVAQALGAAHAAGIVHRDLKPDNVFLVPREGDDDLVKILDFGVARVRGGAEGDVGISGTLGYMSPEQASGGEQDARTDVFSFGVMAYEMLTGMLPYEVFTLASAVTLAGRPRPAPPSQARPSLALDPTLDQLVLRCLEPDSARRPSSMQEVEWCLVAAGAAPIATIAERDARQLGLRTSGALATPAPAPASMPSTAFRPPPAQEPKLDLDPVAVASARLTRRERQARYEPPGDPLVPKLLRLAAWGVAAVVVFELWRRGGLSSAFVALRKTLGL